MSCFFNNFVDILVHISVSENDFRNKLKKSVFKKQIININYRRTATKKSEWKEVEMSEHRKVFDEINFI
jgi:hypothetical protein